VVLLKGLETLDLRVDRHCRNAARSPGSCRITRRIERVLFPGLPSHPQYARRRSRWAGSGNLVSFTVAGGKEGAFRFLDALRLVDLSNNLGDAKSLITHPRYDDAFAPHSGRARRARIDEGLCDSGRARDVADVVEDLETALQAV